MIAKLAKNKIENEEGLNHLWIRWNAFGPARDGKLRIGLPKGVLRKPNLSGFAEDERGRIVIYETCVSDGVLLELYTEGPTPAGKTAIDVELAYLDAAGQSCSAIRKVPLEIVEETEMLDVAIDQEVANLVKLIRENGRKLADADALAHPLANRRWIARSDCSDLEKKYRIEGRAAR
ncbi:hypothetical protein ACF3MZ_06095 [Paenibacillaceae bacterium WGS1546]|uniref:hypothetical protein n=1 Tax=Cohnella sp. WGS1546 TaxID=3366810 RepID=UPI00372D23DC